MKNTIKTISELKSVYKLNPLSDRYRVCPECKTGFMTNHLGRDFDSKDCANAYNNRKKKLEKHAADIIDGTKLSFNPEKVLEQQPEIQQERVATKVASVDLTATPSETQKTTERIIDPMIRKKNDRILSETLGEKIEVNAPWTDLVQIGLDPRAYDSIEKLPHCNLNKANYGNYSIVWVNPDLILITKQKHLLWTSTSI